MIKKMNHKKKRDFLKNSLLPEGWEKEAVGSPTLLQDRASPLVCGQLVVYGTGDGAGAVAGVWAELPKLLHIFYPKSLRYMN